jgi:hypothetical protein
MENNKLGSRSPVLMVRVYRTWGRRCSYIFFILSEEKIEKNFSHLSNIYIF